MIYAKDIDTPLTEILFKIKMVDLDKPQYVLMKGKVRCYSEGKTAKIQDLK